MRFQVITSVAALNRPLCHRVRICVGQRNGVKPGPVIVIPPTVCSHGPLLTIIIDDDLLSEVGAGILRILHPYRHHFPVLQGDGEGLLGIEGLEAD